MNECDLEVLPGEYYLGDPCYTISDANWSMLMDKFDTLNRPGEINESIVLGLGTAWGDGDYRGSDGFDYAVDSGMIGLVHKNAADPQEAEKALRVGLVKLVTFTEVTRVSNNHGDMRFGDIHIDTRGSEEDESWGVDDEDDEVEDDE